MRRRPMMLPRRRRRRVLLLAHDILFPLLYLACPLSASRRPRHPHRLPPVAMDQLARALLPGQCRRDRVGEHVRHRMVTGVAQLASSSTLHPSSCFYIMGPPGSD
jgi:hypothetical protein